MGRLVIFVIFFLYYLFQLIWSFLQILFGRGMGVCQTQIKRTQNRFQLSVVSLTVLGTLFVPRCSSFPMKALYWSGWLLLLLIGFTFYPILAEVLSFILVSIIFLASKNVIFLWYFTSKIFFSFLYVIQILENEGWFSWQFVRLVSLGQSSSLWSRSFWPYLSL